MDEVCAICQVADDDEEGDARHTLECGHGFHAGCIVQWFRRGHSECPLCRGEPEFAMAGMLWQSRAKYLCSVARRKNAPTELKKLVGRLRDAKTKLASARREVVECQRENRDALRAMTRLRTKQRACSMRVRSTQRMVGCFNCTEYPLPSLTLSSY